MKDSGIDWIGKIPDEWEVCKLKYLLKTNLQYGANSSGIEFNENLPRYVRITDIKSSEALYEKGKLSLSEEDSIGYLLQDGDILFARSGATVGKTFLYHSNIGKAAFAGYLIRAQLNENLNPKFLSYYTLSSGYDEWKNRIFIQATIQNIGADKYANMEIPLPPLSEQTKIANFLDKKCAQIDSIIEESKKSIEEYKSWKQSVIFEAVTGKNLSCKKKNSGIEWLGEIPENFIITRIKHIATLAGRIGWQGLTSQEYSDEGCYLITGINFSNGEINWESCVRVPYSRWEEASQIQIENGDLLITKDGTVGKVAIVNNMPDKTSLNSGVLLIRQNKKICSTRFLFWILQSNVFWKWFNYINAGNSTIIHLYQHDFSNFSFPNPSIEIQNEISNYLDKKCAQIDSLISEKQSLIKDLAEYKKSLIFEAVTGKRRV